VKGSVEQSTCDSYSMEIRRHVIPAFRRTKLKNLTTDQVRNFRRCKPDEGFSTRTVQYLLFLLRKALQEAVEDGLIPRNVAHGMKVSQVGKEEIRSLLRKQTDTFLEATASKPSTSSPSTPDSVRVSFWACAGRTWISTPEPCQ
jgi:site-specific recombinase XerC